MGALRAVVQLSCHGVRLEVYLLLAPASRHRPVSAPRFFEHVHQICFKHFVDGMVGNFNDSP